MPDFFAITETWFDANFNDVILQDCFPGYNIFRADRQSRGGGCALLCRAELMCTKIASCCVAGVESLFVSIPILSRPSIIGVIYRSPSCSLDQFDNWVSLSDITPLSCNYDLILTGDFNFPHINWEVPMVTNSDFAHSSFLHFIQSMGLTQLTRDLHVLDLIFSSKPENILYLDVMDSLPGCDHDALFFKFSANMLPKNTQPLPSSCMFLQFDFARADFPSLNDAIFNISWDALFVSCNIIDEIWDLFCLTLHNLFKQFLPQRRVHSFKSKINALPQDLLNLIKLKKSAWSKFRRSRSLTDKNIFRNLSTLLKRRMI